ncbi:MAG: SDR family oxidoreductase [Rubrivivax sp.]|nr:SDR family oxidoreductase [Rubrivivax sp.]
MKKVLVVGANGGSGLAATRSLVARGCAVTAFVRQPALMPALPGRITTVTGDATRPEDIDRVMAGHDAVVVALGIRENPWRVRLRGSAHTALDVRSRGTRHVIDAMHRHGVRSLVVQTSYGVDSTEGRLPWIVKLMFALLLRPQIQDTARQEAAVRTSGLDWVLVQPVNLTDENTTRPAFASPTGDFESMKVSRQQVGEFLADAVLDPRHVGHCVALSAPSTARPDHEAHAARRPG